MGGVQGLCFCKMTDFRGGGESARASLPLKLYLILAAVKQNNKLVIFVTGSNISEQDYLLKISI